MRTGETERAERELRQATELAAVLRPSDAELHFATLVELATCLVVRKRTSEARDVIARALPLVPRGTLSGEEGEFRLQMTLAESYRYDKRPEFAIAPFRAAITALRGAETRPELASRHTEAASRLATTLIQLGRDNEAEPVLEQALLVARRNGRHAEHARLATQLALILMSRNQFERVGDLGARGRLLKVADMTYSDLPLSEVHPQKPLPPARGQAPGSPPPAPSGNIENAAREVAAMRPGFRSCYQATLQNDPQVQGSVRMTMKVAADGRVAELKALVVGLPVETIDCILKRASEAQFNPPDGGSAVIAVPVTFVLGR